MQLLNLTKKEQIELLSDGIRDPILRRQVLGTWINTVPEFIDHVRIITEDRMIHKQFSNNNNLKMVSGTKTNVNSSEKTCFTCKKTGHEAKDC